jgi:hypothetical protein
MGQNYPNPMVLGYTQSGDHRSETSIVTNIPVYIAEDMDVSITVYNVKGQKIKNSYFR